jgi:hypothetical protein
MHCPLFCWHSLNCTQFDLPDPAWKSIWSQSVDHIFSSHLGLIRCLTLIVGVSTQHHIHTFTIEFEYPDKIVLPKELYHGWNPAQAWNLSQIG